MSDVSGNPDVVSSFSASRPERGFPAARPGVIASFAIAATPAEAELPALPVAGLVTGLIETAQANRNATLWDEQAIMAAGLPAGTRVLDVTANPDRPPILAFDIPESGMPPHHIPSFNTRIITMPARRPRAGDQTETTIMVHVHPQDFQELQPAGRSRAWATIEVDPDDTVTRLVTTSADFTQPCPEPLTADTTVELEAFLAAV